MARAVVLLIALLSLTMPRLASARDFDFYVLALSWSPSWCATEDRDGSTPQCDGRRPYTFIAHGLWPQYERGWPEYCPSSEPERVPQALARTLYDIVPSAGLAGHEWRKHGSCSGLSQRLYFETLRNAYRKVRMPPVVFDGRMQRKLGIDEIEALFMKANPGLARDAIAVGCDGGRLTEIRICMTKSLGFRACEEVDRQSCRARTVTLPALP
ncbi:MAG: ribonuclease [Sphingomonadales bacterium]|nr:MAG: ribonuclease [Sphingomonadales bacterium]